MKCLETINKKDYKYLTPAVLWAVCMQESGGNPLFSPKDLLFKQNLAVACKISGLSKAEILKIVTLPEKIGSFTVPAEFVGQVAKFRLEPGYWSKYGTRKASERFRISASWGVTQVMGANINRGENADLHILHFSANIEWQLQKAADMLENLLVYSKGDINCMYRGYNSGRINSQDPAVIARAIKVEQRINGW